MSLFEDPADIPELEAVWAALRRGIKPRTLRLLEIVDERYHRIADVFRTTAGPVIVGLARQHRNEPGLSTYVDRGEVKAARLDSLRDVDFFPAQCSQNCPAAILDVWWIRHRIAENEKRAVWARRRGAE